MLLIVLIVFQFLSNTLGVPVEDQYKNSTLDLLRQKRHPCESDEQDCEVNLVIKIDVKIDDCKPEICDSLCKCHLDCELSIEISDINDSSECSKKCSHCHCNRMCECATLFLEC